MESRNNWHVNEPVRIDVIRPRGSGPPAGLATGLDIHSLGLRLARRICEAMDADTNRIDCVNPVEPWGPGHSNRHRPAGRELHKSVQLPTATKSMN